MSDPFIEAPADGEDDGVQFQAASGPATALTWLPVTSTNVDAAAYEPDYRRLWVKFLPGKKGGPRTYLYYDVPKERWQEFLASNSKGLWVDFVLKGNVGNGARAGGYAYDGPF